METNSNNNLINNNNYFNTINNYIITLNNSINYLNRSNEIISNMYNNLDYYYYYNWYNNVEQQNNFIPVQNNRRRRIFQNNTSQSLQIPLYHDSLENTEESQELQELQEAQESQESQESQDSQESQESQLSNNQFIELSRENLNNVIANNITRLKYSEISNPNDTVCAITQEEFQPNDDVGLINNCGHIFKYTPLLQWLRSHETCPNCRYCILTNSNLIRYRDSHLNQRFYLTSQQFRIHVLDRLFNYSRN